MDALRSVIREVLSESLSPSESFTTKIKSENVDFNYFLESEIGNHYGLSGKEEYEKTTSLYVYWSFSVDARENYIKSLDISIENVSGEIIVTPDPDNDNQIKIHFDAKKMGFEISNNIEIKKGSSIYPYDISIDFKTKTISVT